MKQLVLTIAAVFALQWGGGAEATTTEKVYVCVSPKAYAYHDDRLCRGLGRCTHEIRTVSIEAAKKEGRKACKICY